MTLIPGPTGIPTATYAYNLDGSLASVTNPLTGKLIAYTQNAAGRTISAINGTLNYVTNATYAPSGGLTGMVNGQATGFAGINIADSYNSRFQPLQLYVTTGTISPSTLTQLQSLACPTATATIMGRSYNFAAGASDNGNVQSITNCRDTTRNQLFTYDALNRIKKANSNGSTPANPTSWGETYTIDAWGNLRARGTVANKANTEPLTCTPNNKNQLSDCYSYDIAGNLIQNGTANYTYDAENRLVWTAGYSYLYDGDGNRVEKCTSTTAGVCASGATGTLYWRGISGDTLVESDITPTNLQNEYIFFDGKRVARRDSASHIHYYFSDHLGTHGVVENATGSTCEQDVDYYPYGGVENDYCSGTSVAQNYKFTGKERDAESGLDNFGARYNASTMGRFMTPDPLLNSGRPSSPQTWNRYSYALNNPLKIKDPTGLYNVNCGDDKSCQKSAERLKKGLEKLQNKVDKMKDSDQKTRLEHALGAMGTQNDGNNVNVSFGAIAGTAAATTDAHFDSATNSYSSFDVKFDMSKTGNSDANGMAINGAHEGTHVGDYQDPLGRSQNPATAMDGFQYEFRGYQTSAWAAQALGVSPLSFGGNVIWNSSWAAADRQTLMGRGITGIVTGAPYNQPENPIHDPWPDRFPEPNPGPF